MKVCRKCFSVKDESEYSKSNSYNDKLYPHCKSCVSVTSARYYQQHKEKKKAVAAVNYYKNREYISERRAANYQKNRVALCEYQRTRHRKKTNKEEKPQRAPNSIWDFEKDKIKS